jgi:hypothetical protein
VVSHECLTTIDHTNLGKNHVFVTCDASDWHTGATLTEMYRRDNQIPDSDGFAMVMPKEKRCRSETMSTNRFDKHNTNRPRHAGIPETVLD